MLRALVVIEGDHSVGSGFVATIRGKCWVVTNLHVLSGNGRISFRRLDGSRIPMGDLIGATDRDVALMAIAPEPHALAMPERFDIPPTIHDRVVVPGNSEGRGVAGIIEGEVAGLGPGLIEVTAKFVRGNSGSPVILQSTGAVIGIATYATERNRDALSNDSALPLIRRFAHRIDENMRWERLSFAAFQREAAKVEQFGALTEELLGIYRAFARTGTVPARKYSAGLATQVETLRSNLAVVPSDPNRLVRVRAFFLEQMAAACRNDIAEFLRTRPSYYHRHAAEEEWSFRRSMAEAFEQAARVVSGR